MNSNTLIPVLIEWMGQRLPLKHSWTGMGNVDQFRWLSRADVLRQLEMARDELGLRHVRAAAMYGPESRVCGRRSLAQWSEPPDRVAPEANWQLVDLSFEELIERGLKPVYTTCFTPPGMTDRVTTCWPDKNPVGMPRHLGQWENFVASGLRHHLARFGRREMRSWYFECWNEPNLTGFFEGTQEEFFHLWSATWRALKSVDPSFRIGGPSTARGEWIEAFLRWARKDGTPPDYIISHVYNNDSESAPLSPFDGPASHRVKDSPHFAAGVIRGVKSILEEAGFLGEIHWNEWGRSWFPRDLRREGGLEAAFIVKTMIEVSQQGDFFAFWCLSDIYDQIGFQNSEFEGHYGMLSLHGLRKPAWFAHQMLERLDVEHLPTSCPDPRLRALATHGLDGRRSVLIAAYPETLGDAPERLVVTLPIPNGSRNPRLFRIDHEENNIIAVWRSIGAPSSPTRKEMTTLRGRNTLHQTADGQPIITEDGGLAFEITCPGVALLEWPTTPP